MKHIAKLIGGKLDGAHLNVTNCGVRNRTDIPCNIVISGSIYSCTGGDPMGGKPKSQGAMAMADFPVLNMKGGQWATATLYKGEAFVLVDYPFHKIAPENVHELSKEANRKIRSEGRPQIKPPDRHDL